MTASHKEPNYMGIFWWLLALTILEIATTRLPAPHLIVAILLVGMALSKACLVAMYFMHLRFERKILAMIAATPLVLCVFLAMMLLPDSKGKGHAVSTGQPASEKPAPAHTD